MSTISSLNEKINNVTAIDFGNILSKSVELFKKTWLQGFILILMVFVIMLPLFVAIYMPMYSTLVEQIQSGDYEPNEVSALMMQNENFRYKILGLTFVISFFSTALVAGFYKIIKKIDFGESYTFTDFFYFFKVKYLGKILTIAALSFLVSLVNFAFEKFLPPGVAGVLGSMIAIWFSVYSTLFAVFLAFNPELESTEIFSVSFNLGTRKWALIFGLLVVTGIIGFLGAIACGIGMLFTISIIYLPPYLIYKSVIGFTESNEMEQIESN
jgi:hypothetical protein